ncbi:Ku protein [Streptomyces mirabilis]
MQPDDRGETSRRRSPPRFPRYTQVYELLRAALEEADKAGIATFVMRGKQYLTALRGLGLSRPSGRACRQGNGGPGARARPPCGSTAGAALRGQLHGESPDTAGGASDEDEPRSPLSRQGCHPAAGAVCCR